MMGVIWAYGNSGARYVADRVARAKFISAVSEDSGQPEHTISPERVRDGDSTDFEVAYNNFRRVVKYDAESGEVLKVL